MDQFVVFDVLSSSNFRRCCSCGTTRLQLDQPITCLEIVIMAFPRQSPETRSQGSSSSSSLPQRLSVLSVLKAVELRRICYSRQLAKMASIIRPSPFALRQTAMSLSTAGLRTAFYSTKAPVATLAFLKPLQTKSKLMGAAGFHATARKQILPPLPREYLPCRPEVRSWHRTVEC